MSLPGVNQVSKVLHEGVIYRHIILTVPAMFRTTFYQNAGLLLSALMRCGVQCMDDFFSEVRGKALRGGYIVVTHTHGRNGHYHPHLHLLATSGAMMRRESAGNTCSTCPMRCSVVSGSGIC